MSGRAAEWLRERVPVDTQCTAELAGEALREPIPRHMKHWYYALGATPLILFLFQVATGVLLTFYYVPAPDSAYESVRVITEEARMGYWVRGIHHWGSSLMVIAIFLHMVRVFFTRGYRRPRELNWILGLVLLFLTFALSFTGYSLVYNQLSYWAATVGTNMIREVPIVGTAVLHLLRGGDAVTANTLTRFFQFHVMVLPLLLFLAIAAHIVLVRLHGVSELEGHEGEGAYPFYPEHFYHAVVVALFLLTFMSAMTVIIPPGLGEPANPLVTPQHIKPEWYFFAVYSLLKFVPLKLGIYLLMAACLVAVFWPFIDEVLTRRWPRARIGWWVGSATIVLFVFFTVYEMLVA
jgi:quinol-cytochrome oxidoreductase complex cytochrome b subunit